MYLIRFHRPLSKFKKITARPYSQALLDQSEYTEIPEYPPIVDTSLQGRKLRERQNLHEKIKNVKTVEEKQLALNMPRYYGWQCVMFHENKIPYSAMPMVQGYTRSHFVPIEKLPECYNDTSGVAGEAVKEIKSQIEDAIAMELEGVE